MVFTWSPIDEAERGGNSRLSGCPNFYHRASRGEWEREMRVFLLVRVAFTKDGTFGVLLDQGIPFCVTLERPWLHNQQGMSCILGGEYTCKRVQSPKFGNTFEVMDVPRRTHILFHKGNLMDDSHGCILLGEQYEPIGGKNAIQASGKAFNEFLLRTKDIDSFILRIGIP